MAGGMSCKSIRALLSEAEMDEIWEKIGAQEAVQSLEKELEDCKALQRWADDGGPCREND